MERLGKPQHRREGRRRSEREVSESNLLLTSDSAQSCQFQRRLDFARHDKRLKVAHVYRRSNFGVVVKQFCPIDGFADAAMRGGVARQNPDVHPNTFAGEAKEPFHRRAGKVRSARRRIAARTNPGTYCAAGTVHEIAVKTGMMIGVLFHDVEMPVRRFVSASARRDWAIGHDLVPDHKVSPLLRDRDHDTRIVLRCLFQ